MVRQRLLWSTLITSLVVSAGCASAPVHSWLPNLTYGLLSHWHTDAPDNDPLGQLDSLEVRAEGLDSTDRFHRGY